MKKKTLFCVLRYFVFIRGLNDMHSEMNSQVNEYTSTVSTSTQYCPLLCRSTKGPSKKYATLPKGEGVGWKSNSHRLK